MLSHHWSLFALLATAIQALRIPVLVKTSTLHNGRFPSQVVVPLPKGEYFEASSLGLEEIPSQSIVLERWRGDGSLRHVQVHFLLPKGGAEQTLHFGDEAKLPAVLTPVKVTMSTNLVTVDTGKIRFAVSKQRFNLFDQIFVDYNGNGQYETNEQIVSSKTTNGGRFVDYRGQTQLDADRTDITVTVEQSGPLLSIIKVEAPTIFKSTTNHLHGFAVRIYAFAGQDHVKVDYQLQNSALVKRAWPLYLDEMTLDLDLTLSSQTPSLRFGMPDGTTISTVSPASLSQESHDAYGVYSGTSALVKTAGLNYEEYKLGTGYVHIKDTSRTVTVAGRNFWQMWPNGLRIDGSRVSVELFPKWSAQWEGKTDERSGRISPTGLYWIKDMQHVYKSVLFAFHASPPSDSFVASLASNLQFPPVASLPRDWHADSKATLDLGGYMPLAGKFEQEDPVSPDLHWNRWGIAMSHTDVYYRAGVRNCGDPEGPYRAYPATSGGWPYASGAFVASGRSSDYFELELWGIGEMNVRPQWLPGYTYVRDQATLRLTENPYAGGTWRVFDGHGISVYAADLLPGTENVNPDYGARDDQHGWFYHVMDAYFVTGNPWIKDWYDFVVEFRKVRLGQGDPFPDTSSRGTGHSLAHSTQAARVNGDEDFPTRFRNYLRNVLVPNQHPQYGQQYTTIEQRGGSFETGYLMRTIIGYMEEVRDLDVQGYAEAFNYLSGLMEWNLNYGHFAYEHNAETTNGGIGTSSGTGLTLVDPQSWYFWNTGKREYWDQVVDYVNGGIDGGEAPYGEGFQAWQGSFEGRMYHYVLERVTEESNPLIPVVDLAATKSVNKVTAKWKTPLGSTRFHIVWSKSEPIAMQHSASSSVRNWWACSAVGVTINAMPGKPQSFSFTAPGAKYVAMFVFDENNNMSPMSNMAEVKTTSGFCFPGRMKVDEKTKGLISMTDLQIGDHVKVGDGKFDLVYSFGHYSLSSSPFMA
jgi:hypothetical protein